MSEGAFVSTPNGQHRLPGLAWALALRPLQEVAGLARVLGTVIESASVGGRAGIESLYEESLAVFNQREAPEYEAFGRPVAFDSFPLVGRATEDGSSDWESRLAATIARLLSPAPPVGLTSLQVPTFVGHGTVLAVETEQPLDPKRAADALAAAPGVELWTEDSEGPSTRAVAGRDVVLVGRLRADPSRERGLLLWIASDTLRLAATNAVALAEARFGS